MKKRVAAKENYERAIALEPRFPQAFFRRALHRRQSHPLEAIQDLTEAIRLDPKFIEAYYNRGLLRQSFATDLEEAEKDFKKALELDAGHVYARYQLGRVYGMLAQTFAGDAAKYRNYRGEEIKQYTKLIKDGHELYFVLVARAEAYRDIGEKDEAIQDMKKAQRLKPALLP